MAFWDKGQQTGSTQEHLKFAEIHDGIIITKTGELRAVLMASSINFALKSEQEQNAIIFAYQNFINSLEFPIQILMQSWRLDLGKYLTKLKGTAQKQTNELLKMQTLDYVDFVSRLIQIANIMDKKFYVTVPFMPPPKVNSTAGKIAQNTNQTQITMTVDEFKSYGQELGQRVQVIQSGLGSIGIRSAQLSTQQLIELLYGLYNPEEAMKEKLTEYEQLTNPIVESAIEKPQEKR